MGLFSGADDPNNSANDLIEQQMRENEIQIEEKRRNLYQTRLDVIKAQGAQTWTTPVNNGGYKPAQKTHGGFDQTGYAKGMAKGAEALARGVAGQ